MILCAILTGILTTLIIRRTANASALRTITRRIHADLLEFRLYFDEPLLIWQAWMNLLRDNLRLLQLFLPATLILALPVTWLILQLDTVYGLRPLHPGEATVVTAQLTRPLDGADRFELRGRGGVRVETPPVRIWHDNQIAWRVRPASEGRSFLDLTINGRVVGKSIVAGSGPVMLSPRRSSSADEFLLHPEEPRLPDGDLAWLAVDYPKVDYPNADSSIPWLVWFLAISTVAALLSARLLAVFSHT